MENGRKTIKRTEQNEMETVNTIKSTNRIERGKAEVNTMSMNETKRTKLNRAGMEEAESINLSGTG